MKNKEQEQGVGDMKKQAGQMMHAGIQAEELAVCHMRYPCERVPVEFDCFFGKTKRAMTSSPLLTATQLSGYYTQHTRFLIDH